MQQDQYDRLKAKFPEADIILSTKKIKTTDSKQDDGQKSNS